MWGVLCMEIAEYTHCMCCGNGNGNKVLEWGAAECGCCGVWGLPYVGVAVSGGCINRCCIIFGNKYWSFTAFPQLA